MNKYSKNNYNLDYFLKPSIDNSYWAGFIAGDGHITKSRDKISIKLKQSDRNHLEVFAKKIGVTTIYDYETKDKRTSSITKSSTLLISNKKIVQDLPSLNILGTLSVIEWVLDHTETLVRRRATVRHRGGPLYEVEYHGNDAIAIRNHLHLLNVDFLQRKYSAWEDKGCNLEVIDRGPKHGTRNMYEKHKCRCDECKGFYSEYNRAMRAKRKDRQK